MGLYEYIGDRYEQLFPDSTEKIDFIEGDFPDDRRSLLDVGCADGGLVLRLAERSADSGVEMVGIDPEPTMIAAADRRAQERHLRCRFAVGGMSDLHAVIRSFDRKIGVPGGTEATFGQITCLGNTLAHAGNLDEIVRFLRDCHGLLTHGGVLTVQILNYDYLVSNRMRALPEIEVQSLTFERWNEYSDDGVIFHTRLTDEERGEVFEDKTRLLSLSWEFLESAIVDAGFVSVRRYSDYSGSRFDDYTTVPPFFYVARAEKPA